MSDRSQKTGRFKSGDVELFFRAFGRPGKTPLLIQHGLSYFSYDWIDIARDLAAEREVVAMDMRGFGESDWSPGKDYAVPTFARDAVNLMDHLRWPKAVLVGHSMGGRNSAYGAAEIPGRAAALVLVDYSPQQAPAGSQRVTKKAAGLPDLFPTLDAALDYFGGPKDAKSRARMDAYLQPVAGGFVIKRDTFFRDRFRKALETGQPAPAGVDMWDALKRVRCPIFVLRGRQSDMFAPETVARVKEANPRVKLAEVDSGHNIPGENPAALVREVNRFLAEEAL